MGDFKRILFRVQPVRQIAKRKQRKRQKDFAEELKEAKDKLRSNRLANYTERKDK